MSLLSTTPQLNPTVIENNPTQVMMDQPASIDADFYATGQPIMKKHNAIHVETMDFEKLATMEKWLAKVDWTVGTTTDWFKYEFTIEDLDRLMTDMPDNFQWRDFGEVEFTLKTTLNAFVAGLTVLFYDPSPRDDYWSVMFDITLGPTHKVLFPNVKFEPTKATQVKWTLPFSNPFRMYPKGSHPGEYDWNAENDWIRKYSMGRITAFPLVPLATGTTGITRCPYAFRAKMNNLRVAGTDYAKLEL